MSEYGDDRGSEDLSLWQVCNCPDILDDDHLDDFDDDHHFLYV